MAIALQISSLTPEQKAFIVDKCTVVTKPDIYNPTPLTLESYKVNKVDDEILIPMGMWKHFLDPLLGFPNGEANTYPQMNPNATYTKTLLTVETDPLKRGRDQDVTMALALEKLQNDGYVFLGLNTGYGKCLAPGTKILMYNGTKKSVEDIQVGELIMGDDSTPRTILSTCTGQEEMYEIVPNKGEPFTVNESHILTLKASNQGKISFIENHNNYQVKWFDGKNCTSKCFNNIEDATIFSKTVLNNIFDISLTDYFNLTNESKHVLKSYWTDIDYLQQPITLNPYYLGLWLGDGTASKAEITTIDIEIIHFLSKFAEQENVKISNSKEFSYIFYGLTHHSNHVLTKLQKLNLINNKHIPLNYKANSRQIRLQVLAGLIDSDGYYNDGCYEIFQKRENLAYDIQDLCRSLGYACFVKPCKKGCWYKGQYKEGIYFRINFSGEGLEDIPVLLPRKKASPRKQIKDALVTSFKIIPKGVGTYYGFCIDGNRRFVLGSHMVTHNTGCAIYASIFLKLKTIILCHLDVVKSQWPDEYDKFSSGTVKVQYLKGNKKIDPDADVYIVGIKKVLNIADKELLNIGTVIVDEAHISTVTAFTQSLLKFRPRYLIGLSATYDRGDGLHKLLYPYYGSPDNFIIRKEKKEFTVYKVQTPYEPRIKYVRKNGQRVVDWATVIKSIEENQQRWQNVVDVIMKYPEEKMIVMCNRQAHAKGVFALCNKYEVSAALLIGDTKEWDHSKRVLVTSFKKGGVGLNIPDLTFAIIASDTSDVRQYEGRIRTTNNIIYHFVDHYEAFEKHFKICEKWYREKGATIHIVNI